MLPENTANCLKKDLRLFAGRGPFHFFDLDCSRTKDPLGPFQNTLETDFEFQSVVVSLGGAIDNGVVAGIKRGFAHT